VLDHFVVFFFFFFFFFSSRRRHTRLQGDWSSDVCSSDLLPDSAGVGVAAVPSGVRKPTACRRPGPPPAPGSVSIQTSATPPTPRSEERRVGKECRSRWSAGQ